MYESNGCQRWFTINYVWLYNTVALGIQTLIHQSELEVFFKQKSSFHFVVFSKILNAMA